MPLSKEISRTDEKKKVDMSGKGYKAISKALGPPLNHSQSYYPQIEKTWNSGEPCQEWPAYQNYSKSA